MHKSLRLASFLAIILSIAAFYSAPEAIVKHLRAPFPSSNNTTSILFAEPEQNDSTLKMAAVSVSRSVVKKVLAVETPEVRYSWLERHELYRTELTLSSQGAGALVRRSIGTMKLKNLTPFLLLDHFHVSKGAGFLDHPHRGQATVTYMLEGSSQHEDSAGHKGLIETGGVQWMSAVRLLCYGNFMHSLKAMHVIGQRK